MVVKGKKEKGVWNSYWRYRNCYLITARYHAVPATRTRGSAGWYGMAKHAYSGILSCESELLLCRDLISPHRNKR